MHVYLRACVSACLYVCGVPDQLFLLFVYECKVYFKFYVRIMVSALDILTLRCILCRLVSPSSARMMWHGPSQKYNKPEARKFSLILNSSNSENIFLREYGIRCLADHEIGTHFVSSTMIGRFRTQ